MNRRGLVGTGSNLAAVHLASQEADPMKGPRLLTRDGRLVTHDLWHYFDTLGEVHYPMVLGGNMASHIDMRLGVRDDSGEWVAPSKNSKLVKDARDALYEFEPGAGEVFRRGWINVGMGGRGYLIRSQSGVGPDTEYSIEFCSADELIATRKDGQTWTWSRKSRSVSEPEEIPRARIFDVWRPHPRYSGDADSALGSVMMECRELEALKLSMLARISSRLTSMGILFLPNSLQIPGPNGPVSGAAVAMHLQEIFTTQLKNPGEAAAAAPIVVSGPDKVADAIKHVVLDTNFTQVEENYRADLRATIAQGIELPLVKQTGDPADLNHWSSWAVDEQALVDHVLPTCEMLTQEMTSIALWPWLRAKGYSRSEIRSIRFIADPTEASLSTVRVDAARQLYDRCEIGGESLRRAHGFSELDAPTMEETLRFLGVKLNLPLLATWGMNIPVEDLAPPGMGPGPQDAPPEPYASPENVPTPEGGLDQS